MRHRIPHFTVVLSFLLLLLGLAVLALVSCHYDPTLRIKGVLTEGPIWRRKEIDTQFVVKIVNGHGDTIELRTIREIFDHYPDIYYRADGDHDSLLLVRPSTRPAGWHDPTDLYWWWHPDTVDAREGFRFGEHHRVQAIRDEEPP